MAQLAVSLQRQISIAIREELDEKLYEPPSMRDSPVWATRTHRAIVERVLAILAQATVELDKGPQV